MSQINITLREFINANKSVIGFDESSQCAYDLINRARIIAYPIGDWVGTMVHRPVMVDNLCHFILPHDIDVIREAKSFYGRNLGINSIVSRDDFNCCSGTVLAKAEGRVFLPFQLTNAPLCFYAANKRDKKSIVRVIYFDLSGSMHDEEIELGHSLQEASRLAHIPKSILRITKGSTDGYVVATNGSDYAYLAPRDKSPMFTVYEVKEICERCIVIYAKKRYIPFTTEDADLPLDINPEALSSLIIAVKAKDNRGDNWISEYSQSVSLAKNFLNAELSNEQGTMIGIAPVDYYSQLTEDLNQDY